MLLLPCPSHGLLLLCLLLPCAEWTAAIDNGLGRAPPLGWRSWDVYGPYVDSQKMRAQAAAMVKTRQGDVSLLDVGFSYCSLDDFWQPCFPDNQTAVGGVQGSFHNATGYPLVNETKFPSLRSLTDYVHGLGLKIGFYANNCGCEEHQTVPTWGPPASTVVGPTDESLTDGIRHYEGDVQAIVDWGFDGVKLDGCGAFRNLSVWAELLNKTGRPVLIEDCHWGGDGPVRDNFH